MKMILLIDDDEDECLIFSEALDMLKLPLSLSCLKDPTVALEWIQSNTADFIFMDMVMPKINGIDLMHDMQTAMPLLNSKFILLSTLIDERLNEKGIAAGAVACIQKTDTVKAFADILRLFFADYQL